MFKKQTVFEQEPRPISEKDVSEDLQVEETDCLYSDIIKTIILSTKEQLDADNKSESHNTKSFRTVDKILQMRDDVLFQRKFLEEKLNTLAILSKELSQTQFSDMCDQNYSFTETTKLP